MAASRTSFVSVLLVLAPWCVFARRVGVDKATRTVSGEPDTAAAEVAPPGSPAYFLTRDEVEASRNGVPREDLRLYSTNNKVSYLPNGDKFMGRLYDVLSSTRAGDFVYATFWEINVEVILKPVGGNSSEAAEANEAAKLINVWAAACARGVDVRVLVSAGLAQHVTGGSKQCDLVNSKCGAQACVMDDRHGAPNMGSSHEKIWMVRLGSRLHAFSGSMDVADSRWDTAHHNIDSPRWKKQPHESSRAFAWHGTMYEIEGDAAVDILTTFVTRWNDPIVPGGQSTMLPQLALWTPVANETSSGLPVQVVRTFSCKGAQVSGIYQRFAPDGEFSYAALWYKALRRARRYVFLADQFVWFDEAMAAVVEAAEHVDFVFVMTDPMETNFDLPTGQTIPLTVYSNAVQFYQHQALIDALSKRDPSGALAKKVHMFKMVREGRSGDDIQDQIYDHEKTLIIDDEFALVGSTGVERTAFTNDADLSIAVESGEYVTNLRRQMFAEYLLLPPNHTALETPESSYAEWMRQAEAGQYRVRNYMPNNDQSMTTRLAASTLMKLLEPDGRCDDEAHSHQWQAALDAGTPKIQDHLDIMRATRLQDLVHKMGQDGI